MVPEILRVLGPTMVCEIGWRAEDNTAKSSQSLSHQTGVGEVSNLRADGDRLAYTTLELCADGRHNREEIAEMMASALSRPIKAGGVNFHEWAAPARAKYTEHQLGLLAKVYEHYAAVGLGGNSLSLRAALGRKPGTCGPSSKS